ncbi:MAG: amidohydrolase family protein, partial [Maribacter sp.]
KPLVEKAHALGMRVSGHIPAYMTASQAIDQGYNEIQHMNMLFLNFLSDSIDTRTPLRFTMVAEHGLDLDLKSKKYLDFVGTLKDKKILIDPTVAIFENMFVSQKGEPSPTFSKIMSRLPVIRQRKFYAGGLPKTAETSPIYKKSYDKMLAVVNDLFEKNVSIVPGTDGLPGFLYHRELELYERSGIPAVEVLKMATIKSAEITGVSKSFGSIEVGKNADLILIDGNPLENISDVRKVEWTMKGGNLYYAKELYNAMGIQHFK